MKKLLPVLGTILFLMFTEVVICDNISNIQFSPISPASLTFSQDVNLSFDYTTDEAGGVRIFARPFSGGSLTPNYAASGSPLYPVGSGSGTGSFTILSGDAMVDEIRFQMYNSDQSVLLLEFFIPVEYYYSVHSISNILLSPEWPTSMAFNQDVNISFDYTTDEAGGVRIFARPFSGGSLTPNYAASGSPLYPVGSGSGTGSFTILSGDAIVDEIRFQMYDAGQTVLLLEFFIPVEYHYASNSISNIQLAPMPPASLAFNQDVSITFDYTTDEAGGVRIFARPFSGGSLTPNYSASGSPLYPVGNGSGTGSFRIMSGDAVVDEIRFQMYDAGQTVLLLEFFIPVEYHYSANSVSNILLSPPPPAYFTFNQDVNISFDYTTDEAGGVRIFARPFSGGSLTPNYAASGSPLYPVGSGSGSGSFTIMSGDAVVDEIRFQMYDAGQTVLLLQFFIPVEYHFSSVTDVGSPDGNMIGLETYILNQNYPNPFNPSTKIQYYVPLLSDIVIKVFDVMGREINILVNEEKPAGNYEITWNPENLPSGVYFYQLKAGGFIQTKKMILVR